MSKLTLSVDPQVVAQAKLYAKQRGVSLSEMVETYLAAVSAPSLPSKQPPVLSQVRGMLKSADVQDYKRYLEKKYR